MALTVVHNKKHSAVILITGANTTVTVAGNNSVSNIGLSGVTDTIVGAGIKQIWFSSDSGAGGNGWDILRGSNTVWQTDSTGWQDFAGTGGGLLDVDSTATIVCNRTGSRGTLMLELRKIYTGSVTSDY